MIKSCLNFLNRLPLKHNTVNMGTKYKNLSVKGSESKYGKKQIIFEVLFAFEKQTSILKRKANPNTSNILGTFGSRIKRSGQEFWRSSNLKQKLTDDDEDEDTDEDDDIIPPHRISSACQRQSGANKNTLDWQLFEALIALRKHQIIHSGMAIIIRPCPSRSHYLNLSWCPVICLTHVTFS